MPRLIAIAALLLAVPVSTVAQEAEHPYRGQGYIFFGLGTATGYSNPFFEHVGGGGEGFLYKGFGFGAEAEYAHAGGGYEFSRAWVGSADFSCHLGRHAAQGKADPFVLGGFSVVGPTQKGNGRGSPGGNFGGGANLWFRDHAGLRLEFRDVVGSRFWPYDHVLSFRIGLTFR